MTIGSWILLYNQNKSNKMCKSSLFHFNPIKADVWELRGGIIFLMAPLKGDFFGNFFIDS